MIELYRSSFQDKEIAAMSEVHRAAFGDAQAWDQAALARLAALPATMGQVALAVEQDRLAGFILLSAPQGAMADILTLAVHPKAQRQGIATQLMHASEPMLQECGAPGLILEVALDNAPAIALYHAQGFSTIHRRKGYYRRGEGQALVDALVMQKML